MRQNLGGFGRRSGGAGIRPAAPAPTSAPQAERAATPAPPAASETAEVKPALRSPAESSAFLGLKQRLFSSMVDAIDLAALSKLAPEVARDEILQILNDIIADEQISVPSADRVRLVRDIANQVLGYGPLQPLLERDDISDIMVNGAGRTFIEVDGKTVETDVVFDDDDQLMAICQRIVSAVGRRVDESSPICDARLPDGSRVNVIAPPLAIDGPTLTIRKFKRDKLTLDHLVRFGSITEEGAEILRIIGRVRCNVLISGGTGSGKTTLLNCLTAHIDADERIVTCEDSAELQLQQPHVVRLETRPANLEGQGLVSMRDLVKNCLRMRPERIIVGEVRGAEAFDLLQAMNTGHDGSMGTLHANSPREALSRLESMISVGGFNLPSHTVREMMVSSIDLVVQASRLRDGRRVITHITEVVGMEGDVITTQDLFTYDITGEDARGRIQGVHRSTGIGRPVFWDRARYYGEHERLAAAIERADTRGGADEAGGWGR